MKYDKVLSDRIKELRVKNGLSQHDLDTVLGFNDAPISDFERGSCFPKYETLLALADFFQVSLDYITGRSDDATLKQ